MDCPWYKNPYIVQCYIFLRETLSILVVTFVSLDNLSKVLSDGNHEGNFVFLFGWQFFSHVRTGIPRFNQY